MCGPKVAQTFIDMSDKPSESPESAPPPKVDPPPPQPPPEPPIPKEPGYETRSAEGARKSALWFLRQRDEKGKPDK
jgi:hypothetical protein